MRLENISWKQAEAYFKTHDTVIIPIGSIENHGPHLALGTDYIIPSYIADYLDLNSGALVAPAVPYGIADHHRGFCGTISIGYDGLHLVMEKITDCLYEHGARKFIFLNGHGGNDPALLDVALHLEDRGALCALINWWQLAGELNPDWRGGHGGAEETSAIMAINPKLVQMQDYMPCVPQGLSANLPCSGVKTVSFRGANITVQRHFKSATASGWYGDDDPLLATPEWGREMLDCVCNYILEFIAEFAKIEL